jgi:hypothetical protein
MRPANFASTRKPLPREAQRAKGEQRSKLQEGFDETSGISYLAERGEIEG